MDTANVQVISAPTQIRTRADRTIVARWRKAVSLTEDDEGGLFLHRYDKKQQRWIQLLYFKGQDDFEEFIDFLDSIFDPEKGSQEEASQEDVSEEEFSQTEE